MNDFRVACIIPTYNGLNELKRLVHSLSQQTYKHDILIVDSSSTDGTYEFACHAPAKATQIPTSKFNHGGTRQLLIDANPDYDIYVLMTQDAYLDDTNSLKNIIALFDDERVGAVCGRQVPHDEANLLAQHARLFNYPPCTEIKSPKDSEKLGIKVAFLSNSFSAYRRTALNQAGGFPSDVILSEDMYVAAKMLLLNWKIGYAGEATCKHSHNYSILEEFRRYFDIGVFHARESWIKDAFGGAGKEGWRYIKSEFLFLGIKNGRLWPSALLRNTAKLLAYKLGQHESLVPRKIKLRLTMHRRYWDNE